MRHRVARLLIALAVIATGVSAVSAQRGRGAGPAQPAQSPQASAPIDLTGYWVSIVNEDWRWRMITPPKGDFASVQNLMTPEARKLADSWEPSQDGSCLAYGAAALMRMPTRLHITWENENTLKIDTDAGQQTRRLIFDKSTAVPGQRSLQGFSLAEWERFGGGGGGRGGGGGAAPGAAPPGADAAALGRGAAPSPGAAPAPATLAGRGAPAGPGGPQATRAGNLKVITTNLSGGWLRRNGVPYSEMATVTEFYDRFAVGGDQWLVVTTVVSDPKYLTQDFVTSSHFRREPDAAKWDPTPCKPAL